MNTSGNYRISLKGKVFEVPISVVGRTSIERSDDAARIIDCAVPQSISAEASDGGVLMDVIASEPPNIRFSSQLLVRDLAFARIEQFLSSDQPLVRRVSTIIGGSILFTELNDKGYKLRAGEVIGLDGLSGELRTLELYKDHMTASFTGHLKGLTTGSSQSLRTLMPTWLEWLEARHGLSLLWGSAAYIFGLACAVARWWNS